MHTGPTARERLESLTAEYDTARKRYDAIPMPQRTAADDTALQAKGAAVVDAVAKLGAVDPPDGISDARSSQPWLRGMSSAHFMGAQSAPSSGTSIAAKGSGVGPAAFNFSPDQLGELQKAALSSRVMAKAAITSANAPMSEVSDFRYEVFPFLRDKTRLLDLIPVQTTDRSSVTYFRSTAAAAAAAPVLQGGNKPESEPTWAEVEVGVRKLAHYTRVNDEVVADFSGFLQIVGSEMLSGLIDVENEQLLIGTGTAPELSGLTTAVGVQTVGSAGTDLDAIAAAMLLLRNGAAHCDPDVVVLNPIDWYSAGFVLAKDTTGRYLTGDPTSTTKPTLWGIPVVLSESMTENTAMVANLSVAATAYLRQPPIVEVRPGGGTAEFVANQTLIRAEERLALAVHHPAAIVLVTAV